ncbi:MAG: ABC transporter ATP-binding protein [Syntrophomonas sp.]|uniref:ABC transporter ATP-binding protein n=1 Tax=Syntrophomonas sp. TaxID=2053627 RepID=UPI00261B40D1|nr:ABC transporter ATP-binding protein [Syntrophomonas sp.]MDD2510193.1 ABC transporter ATP-binding protein [Syntrophomonas sp.]MDD3880019.1 ABC transporter ATP-binding protein [Syntrophomonas sp.]MDD4625800.1 ABC transporter ATP-binding protein [Syntrophomonas sp.]
MIEFKKVSKRFGSTQALDKLDANFPTGKIIGLFGPNGAGKSTSIKMIAGLNRPDQGQVLIDGELPRMSKAQIAYLPEIDHLYPWMTVGQAAEFTRTFYGDWDNDKYHELLKYLNLSAEMKTGKISKGQRAKTKLLLTVARRAPYLLMDEPLSGIDILTREEIINALVRDYREGEQTIIISTHEIAEVESLVDEVFFIDQGKIMLSGSAEEFRVERGQSLVEIMKEAFRHVDQ